MLRVVMAAAAFHAKNGKWPERIETLVPGALKEPVRDIYSPEGKEPVRYVVTEKGVRVYSVGQNGVDDGGVYDRAAKKLDDIVVGVRGGVVQVQIQSSEWGKG